MRKLGEECGVFGIYDYDNDCDVAMCAYYALFALQHRGQESCGIAVNEDGLIRCHRESGLVNDVFDKDTLATLQNGRIAIGHVRYGVHTHNPQLECQPVTVNHVCGSMAIANNGVLTNALELREELENGGAIFAGFSDAEILAHLITKHRLQSGSVEQAVARTMGQLKGAFSTLIMTSTKLIAARDKQGFHPLSIGRIGGSYVFASETCALDTIGAEFVRDVRPGEIVIADKNGLRSDDSGCPPDDKTSTCVFEYIYFARPDSVVDGVSVHMARRKAGELLAKQHPVEADVVIGVPDSGLDAAIGYAEGSGIPYGIGLIKNKYIGRTFIKPQQHQRENSVRIKLNAVPSVVAGKRVIMVDDSIVRGTTCAHIVKLLRDCGAKEVHMRSSAPKFLYPCYYGTDIDSPDKLIAVRHTTDEMAEIIGVDTLDFLAPKSVHDIAEGLRYSVCDACFTGNYPCETPNTDRKPKHLVRLSERDKGKEEKA